MNQRKIQNTVQTALALHQRGDLAEAARLYDEVCRNAPRLFDGWHLSGALAFQQGRTTEAVERLQRARRIDPTSAPNKLFLGMALADLGQFAEAEKPLRAALEKFPEQGEGWLNLARCARALGRPAEDAIASLRRAIAVQPDRAATHEELGELLVATEGLAAAEPHFRRATELDPELACAWTNLGLALIDAPGRFNESFACLDRAIAADPMNSEARAGRALALLHAYRQEDAANDYETALVLDPNNLRVLSAHAMLSNYLANRAPAAVFATHAEFGRAVPATVDTQRRNWEPERRLRVGIVSPDLREHPVATFFEPLLQHLDRSQFDVVLFHNDSRTDAVSERLKSHASGWRNLHGISDDEAAALIAQDVPDVLVDLAGHSAGNRLPLFARRLAPVQLTYLGYPNTTGLAAMDFRFTDAIADPAGEADRLASERLVRFAATAWSYLPPAEAPAVAERPVDPDRPISFGSFNNFTKVTDDVLRTWAGILAAVPGSRLVLKSRYFDEPGVATTIRARLRAAGMDDERVELLAPQPGIASHLENYGGIDIALDPFPYNGTTTTCEAMWMGVPVVTLAGDRHAARVGCSLLTAVGHPEWIAASTEDYIRLAAGLASDRSALARFRSGLRAEMQASPLLDHAGQAARFGAALRECWQQRCAREVVATAALA